MTSSIFQLLGKICLYLKADRNTMLLKIKIHAFRCRVIVHAKRSLDLVDLDLPEFRKSRELSPSTFAAISLFQICIPGSTQMPT